MFYCTFRLLRIFFYVAVTPNINQDGVTSEDIKGVPPLKISAVLDMARGSLREVSYFFW
jgi:hypothetical protein